MIRRRRTTRNSPFVKVSRAEAQVAVLDLCGAPSYGAAMHQRQNTAHTSVALGGAIRRMRVAAGLSSSDLAEATGLSSMRMIECGHRNPSLNSLGRIITALGVTWTELYTEAGIE